MKDEIKIIQDEDGHFVEYDDTYDLTIHCTSQEEQDEVLMELNRTVCTDAISRQTAIDACLNGWNKDYKEIVEEIRALPPVTPQYTDTEIQKMQDLEFAEIQKAYEIGKAENPSKWIPVSERYPTDTSKRYLVCYEDGCITIEHLYFDGDGHPFFSEMELGVVAWMPLPLPWKGE